MPGHLATIKHCAKVCKGRYVEKHLWPSPKSSGTRAPVWASAAGEQLTPITLRRNSMEHPPLPRNWTAARVLSCAPAPVQLLCHGATRSMSGRSTRSKVGPHTALRDSEQCWPLSGCSSQLAMRIRAQSEMREQGFLRNVIRGTAARRDAKIVCKLGNGLSRWPCAHTRARSPHIRRRSRRKAPRTRQWLLDPAKVHGSSQGARLLVQPIRLASMRHPPRHTSMLQGPNRSLQSVWSH